MATQRRLNIISQQRIDSPDLKSIESSVSNDFDQLIQGFVTGTSQGYVIRGFNILLAGAIGGASNGLLLNVDPGALLHIAASQSGTILMVPTGTSTQQLNSATNTIVDGAFAPSAINYVSIDYERFIDPTTSAQVYIWDPSSNSETTKNAPRAQILRYRIKITTTTPLATYLPIATVVTDAGNNVVSIQDDRHLFGRLGRGGLSPNPSYVYPWLQGRTENPVVSTSNAIDPFFGGDKVIDNLKSLVDAFMTSFLEVKGTPFWYSTGVSGSLYTLKEDLGNTVVTGKGSIAHGVDPSDKITPTAVGQLNWDQDINLRVISSSLTYKLLANSTSTDITLADDEVAYVTLIRGISISPNLIWTNGFSQAVVTSVGSVPWTSPLIAGDYIKLASATDAGYYQIFSVDSASQVTLTTNVAVAVPSPGAQSKYAFGTYQNVPAPSTNRDIFIASRNTVPEGQDVFWLFMRTDNGGTEPRVYIRFLGAELDEGEDRDISDTTSEELLIYIGSPSEATFSPQYVSALTPGSVPQITSITVGSAATLTSNQYFFINSSANSRKYAVWVNKDGTGIQPNAPGVNAYIEWDVSTGQTATQTATALANALNGTPDGDFSAVGGVGVVTVTNTSAGTCTAASNFNVGAPFAISITQSGTGIGNYSIVDGDNLTLSIKKVDEALADVVEELAKPSYDETVDIVASGATPPTSLNGPIVATTTITLPDNSRLLAPQKYTVGAGRLQVFLNGQYLRLGADWSEVGAANTQSNMIETLQTLVVGDVLEFRINLSAG